MRCTLAIYVYINDLEYFSNVRISKEFENISVCDLEVYINHLIKWREDFKIRFGNRQCACSRMVCHNILYKNL